MTTEEDGNTLDGTPPERFAPELERRGATIIGVNCAVGPAPMLETIERMEAVTRLQLSAQPNAGKPRDVEGRNIYLCSPEYMASYARRFILHNVRVVGGCCGTTPEHIRQIKAAVRGAGTRPRRRGGRAARAGRAGAPARRDRRRRRCRASRSRGWRASWRAGTFVLGVELLPPRGFEARAGHPARARAEALRRRRRQHSRRPARRRAAERAVAGGARSSSRPGIETLLHYSCRDRNLLGIQSDLLGAHAMGLRNLLLITGDPGRVGDYPDATAVFDVDSIGLTNVVTRLNHGCDVGGQAIGAPTGFHIGVSVNPAASNLDEELRRFDYKVEAGAEFVLTRPVFDLGGFERFLKRIEHGAAAGRRRRSSRSKARETPSSWPTKCPACACPRRCWSGCGEPTATRRPRPRASRLRGRSRRRLRRLVQGIQVSTAVGQYRRGAGRPRWTSLTVQMYSRSVRSGLGLVIP